VRAVLDEAGLAYTIVPSGAEPTVQSLNAAVATLGPIAVRCIVACGGGAVIDTGKALRVALQKGSPLTDADFGTSHDAPAAMELIVLPTTAGTGAEVTRNAVLGAERSRAKISLRGTALQPNIAIVDPELMQGAPRSVVLNSGLDAVVQNIESYTSAFATPFTRMLSGPAIQTSLTALRGVVEQPDAALWRQMAWGSLTSGLALANGGLGAVHGLASVLGGRYDAPHGALCGRLLAPVLRMNLVSEQATPEIRQSLMMCQQAVDDVFPPDAGAAPLSGFEAWIAAKALPRLSHWGLSAAEIDDVAQASVTASSSLKNAVRPEICELVQVLRDAM